MGIADECKDNIKIVVNSEKAKYFELSKKILDVIKDFGKPVKEIYILCSYDEDYKNMIYRKNDDGEYTLTVY